MRRRLTLEQSAARILGTSVQELDAAWERAQLAVHVGRTRPMPTQSYFHMNGRQRRLKRRTKENNTAYRRMQAARQQGRSPDIKDILAALPEWTNPPPNPYPKIKIGRPLPHRMLPALNDSPSFMNKPMSGGGFWTSTYLGSVHISDWVEWCRGEAFPHAGEYRSWLLEVEPSAFVLELDGPEACEQLFRLGYMYIDPYWTLRPQLDFEKLASVGVHGVHLTERGNQIMHLNMSHKPGEYEYDFNAWDAESTVWLAWSFRKVWPGPKITIPARG